MGQVHLRHRTPPPNFRARSNQSENSSGDHSPVRKRRPHSIAGRLPGYAAPTSASQARTGRSEEKKLTGNTHNTVVSLSLLSYAPNLDLNTLQQYKCLKCFALELVVLCKVSSVWLIMDLVWNCLLQDVLVEAGVSLLSLHMKHVPSMSPVLSHVLLPSNLVFQTSWFYTIIPVVVFIVQYNHCEI